VWTIYHSYPPRLVDGLSPAILAIRDVASGCQLAWLPVPDMSAETTALVLATLFAEDGSPLLLKSDNGSAFRSQVAQDLLADHRVVWVPSPVRTPQHNGSCEAGIGSMKVRTLFLAPRDLRAGNWTSDDPEAARDQATTLTRPHGHLYSTPFDLGSQRAPITESERTEFHSALQRHRGTHRPAVRRATVELGLFNHHSEVHSSTI